MSGWTTNGVGALTPANYLGSMSPQYSVDTLAPSGVTPETGAIGTGATLLGAFASLVAAGTTQLGAAAVTAFKNVITVATTASTHGVRLPAAVTGLAIVIANNGTFGVKVYPATGNQIAAASTNAADTTVLAINKTNIYHAVSALKWVVFRGA